jgi:hypothetical protein
MCRRTLHRCINYCFYFTYNFIRDLHRITGIETHLQGTVFLVVKQVSGPPRPVKVIAQRATCVMTLLLSVYFLNPWISTFQVGMIKKLGVDLITSISCLFFGKEVYYIMWNEEDKSWRSLLFANIVRYIGYPVFAIGVTAWICLNFNSVVVYPYWFLCLAISFSTQQVFVIRNTRRLRRLLRSGLKDQQEHIEAMPAIGADDDFDSALDSTMDSYVNESSDQFDYTSADTHNAPGGAGSRTAHEALQASLEVYHHEQ